MIWLPKRQLWTPERERIGRARKMRSRRGFLVNPCCCNDEPIVECGGCGDINGLEFDVTIAGHSHDDGTYRLTWNAEVLGCCIWKYEAGVEAGCRIKSIQFSVCNVGTTHIEAQVTVIYYTPGLGTTIAEWEDIIQIGVTPKYDCKGISELALTNTIGFESPCDGTPTPPTCEVSAVLV